MIRISELQGDNFRRIHGTNIHFVKSGYLLKLDYAICCSTDQNFSYYAYKLAREYTELYKPQYGTGLIPESAPKLLEIAEFWCQYYFGQNLKDKFPTLFNCMTLSDYQTEEIYSAPFPHAGLGDFNFKYFVEKYHTGQYYLI